MTLPLIAVIGGANMDIGGRSHGPLVPGDSNPGAVRLSLGGVGRNIAHDLSLLGCSVALLTALGDDLYARRITDSCRELHIQLCPCTVPGEHTSTYLFLSGPDGDMALAVNDMAIYDRLTPAWLQTQKPLLDRAALAVVDANLPEASLAWLCDNIKAPIFADPVSAAKAGKLKPLLSRLHTLKPNRLEAQLLTGVEITDDASLSRAAQALLDAGVKRVFLSLGSDGVYAADRSGALRLPCLPARPVNTTGAGDAFLAALCWAHLDRRSLADAARLAQAAAAIAIEGEGTINPALSAAAVLRRSGLEAN